MCASSGRVCERKASEPLDLSRRSNKSSLSRAAFCVWSANRQPEIISHNSLLQKQEEVESPDDCEGAYDSGRGEQCFAVILFISALVLK